MTNKLNIDIDEFLNSGFDLKKHLSDYLGLSHQSLETHLSKGLKELSVLHPGSFRKEDINAFYEVKVGTRHLLELANWHLQSASYIADTLRLQKMFARGNVLDFGGGIGTHSLAASLLPDVEHVYFVDLNPENRAFVKQRVQELGVGKYVSIYRDLDSITNIKFDTVVCLDVLEHLPNPSAQLLEFKNRLTLESVALMNWYFFKGNNGEYPFHIDDKEIVQEFFSTLQTNFIELFHPFLITTRAYKPLNAQK